MRATLEHGASRGYPGAMTVRVLFRCEFCGAEPDSRTRRSLEAQLQELLFGTYLDAEPGHWLVWHGGGLYGRTRYACGEHRGELKAHVREHYGTDRAPSLGDGPAPGGGLPARAGDGAQARRAGLVLAAALGPDDLTAAVRPQRPAGRAAATAACP